MHGQRIRSTVNIQMQRLLSRFICLIISLGATTGGCPYNVQAEIIDFRAVAGEIHLLPPPAGDNNLLPSPEWNSHPIDCCQEGRATLSMGQARTIDFESVLAKVITNAYDLKASKIDIDISRSTIKETRSLYFPALSTRFNSEYIKDLTGGVLGVAVIGNTVLTGDSKYQNSLAASLSYPLFDFGVRKRRMIIAKGDVKQKGLVYNQTIRELKLKILELYTSVLLTYKEIRTKGELLGIYQELFQIKERLFGAGNNFKIDVVDEAIRIARTLLEIDNLKIKLKMLLRDISFYTQEEYNSLTICVQDLKGDESAITSGIDAQRTLFCQIYQIEIDKKTRELQIVKRQNLPQLGLYSNYTLYGSDIRGIEEAIKDLKERNLTVGLSITFPLFDGFANNARKTRLRLEIERLKIERDKKLAELKKDYEEQKELVPFYQQELENKQQLFKKTQDKTTMIERLVNQEITDKAALLNQKIELITQGLELEKAAVNKASAIKKLKIIRYTD